jgi:hypothetical protein
MDIIYLLPYITVLHVSYIIYHSFTRVIYHISQFYTCHISYITVLHVPYIIYHSFTRVIYHLSQFYTCHISYITVLHVSYIIYQFYRCHISYITVLHVSYIIYFRQFTQISCAWHVRPVSKYCSVTTCFSP